jgi:hypothetical protein
LLVASALAASVFSAQSTAENVEVYLLDRIDGILNHYCMDVNGPPQGMQLDSPLQVHTCYSFQGDLTPDQAMDTEDIALGKIRIVAPDLCAQLDGADPGATVTLADCVDDEQQSFELKENGQFVSALHPELCLTAGPTSWLGGPVDAPNERQARTLHLQRCGDEAERYQRWGTRTEMPKPQIQ